MALASAEPVNVAARPARIAAAIAVAAGERDAVEPVLAVLGREAIDASVTPLEHVLATPAVAGMVVVTWDPRGLTAVTVDQVVAWAHGAAPPVGLIAVVADGDVIAAEVALRAGYDDAAGAGCSPRELAARIRAVHRRVVRTPSRGGSRGGRRLTHRNLVLDPDSCELWIDGRAIALTVTEFTMVVALVRARGGVLTRTELLDQAWGNDSLEVGERAVDNVVLRLRKKVGRPELIETVRGIGFRLGRLDGDE